MLSITRKGTWQQPAGPVWNYYGDDTNDKIFYIVPLSQFVFDKKGKPIFSVVEYKTNDGSNGSGYCQFEAMLAVPAGVETGVKADINAKFGIASPQFNTLQYNAGTTAMIEYFDQDHPKIPVGVQVTPSLTDANTASFLIELNKTAMDTFKAAFSSATGSIPLSYALSVDARLPQIKATVTFDAQAAYTYEKDTKVDKNVWGDVTRRQITVREYLTQSQAGKINIDPGDPAPPPDVMAEVDKWAKDTLAKLVQGAVDEVLASIDPKNADRFSINLVQSFRQTYERSQVVKWLFSPTATLPSMPALGFKFEDFYQLVDARRFTVNVTMNLNFALPGTAMFDENESIKSVDVTIHYPGLIQNTFSFDGSTPVGHLFETKWDKDHGGEYGLDYTVNYAKSGQPPLIVKMEDLDQSVFTVTPYQAGILSIEFDARNIDFEDPETGFQWVQLSFFFQDLSGNNKPITVNFQLDAETETYSVQSIFALPIYNKYIYSTTFKPLNPANAPFTLQAQESNAATIFVRNPYATTSLFIVLNDPEDEINYALLKVWYNPGLDRPPVTKNYKLVAEESSIIQMPVSAVDTDQVLFHYQGTMLLNDNGPKQIVPAITAADIVISPNTEWFSVMVDPSLIDWTGLAQVKAEVRYVNSAGLEVPVAVRAMTKATASSFLGGFYHPSGTAATYKWYATYSYSDKDAVTMTGDGTSPHLSLPPKPKDLEYNIEEFETARAVGHAA